MAGRTIIYRGRKFALHVRTIHGRDGAAARQETIVHPGAAVILPILPDDRILLLRNRRHSIERTLIELPAGTLDPRETPRTCAARELTEETGYVAGRLRKLLTFYATPGFCTERMHVFLAERLSPGPAAPEPTEFIRLLPMTLRDALAAIQRGRIIDGKTIAALLYYHRFGLRGARR